MEVSYLLTANAAFSSQLAIQLGMFGTNLFCDNDSFPALVVSRLRLSIWLKLGNNLRNFSW